MPGDAADSAAVPGGAPAGVVIRTQREDELAEVQAVNDLAFGDTEAIGALVAALLEGNAVGGRSYVAVADEQIVGHTMLSTCWLDARERLLTIPVLSPLAVHPEHQGKGVGRALVRYAVEQAAQDLEIGVLLEGDPALYGRWGFEPAEAYGLLRPSRRIPWPAFQWIRLPAHEPWMRGQVIYPPQFWSHDAVGLRGWERSGPELVVTTVTIGARDVERLANFYADLLGRERPTARRLAEDATWVPVRDPDGGIAIAIQHEPYQEPAMWPGRDGKQHMQIHLEIRVDDLSSAVAHAISCGATLAEVQPQSDVRVCIDPEGHPFCLWTVAS
ncbi:MAG: GNAT family N-acetyltransferase [Actinomycetia bacterium]|nr:GNAT family N-acetyltransferase [Actinomycetes bacterium]